MRPEYLSFCGINSFSKRAEIDFNKLLSGGIFGIFGDTGSGKTTILDAMIFALYGRIDRTRGGNGNEIINYNCDKASVTFDFRTEWEGKRRLFRIEREIKKKNSMQSLTLSELDGGRILPVSDGVKNTNQKIQEIVGLSFEDFKKCIALPQGEFAQFVKAERSERLKLISRLFGLDKYGELLNARIKKKLDAVRSEYDRCSGALQSYGLLDEETLKGLEKEVAELAEQKTQLDTAFSGFERAHLSLKAAYERTCKRQDLSKKLEKLLSEQEQFRALRERLARYPAAKEIAELDAQCKKLEEEIAASEKSCKSAALQLEEIGLQERSLIEKFDGEKNSEQTEEIAVRLAGLDAAKQDAAALREKQKKREDLRRKYQEEAEKKGRFAGKEQELSLREKEIAEQLRQSGEDSLDLFLADNLEDALLTAEFRRARQYFSDKREQLHQKFSDGELFRAVDEEIASRLKFYGDLLDGQKSRDVSLVLEEYRRLQKMRQDLQNRQRELLLEKANASNQAQAAQKELERISEEGTLLKKETEALEKKIRAITGTDTQGFEALEKSLSAQKKKLQEEKKTFEQRSKDLQERRQSISLAQAREQTSLEKRREDVQEKRQKRDALLQENAFADAKEAAALAASVPDAKDAERRVKEYDDELLSVRSQWKAFAVEGEKDVSAEEFRQSEDKVAQMRQKKESVAAAYAVCMQDLTDKRKRLQEKKTLEKELARHKAQTELVSGLRELVKNNAFMEFVANEYLSDIAVAATKTLLQLTGGRYFIRYESGFFVGDNLCGGELRSVNTLSGGETFLVSLSLALSLSSAIYAKSLRPIEFFFLDEGFGTLDEKLIDTVMDSLEKLRNSHFSIGLISHVEELKHRIGNKILVTGAAEGGSSEIQISY